MVRYATNLIGWLMGGFNFATFVLSLPILGTGIWLATKADTHSEKFLQWPLITIGAFLMIFSLAGFVGVCCRLTWLIWLYLAAMFILILLLFSFTLFSFVVTNKGAGQAVSGRGYKEYRLEDYSKWLQKRVEKSSNWNTIKSFLQDNKVCEKLAHDSFGEVAEQFYTRNLSPIQSGCCKPPTSCGFVYVNATYWIPRGNNSRDMDCRRWSNEQDEVCYDCDSCKAGVLANLKHDWRKIGFINVVVFIVLVVVYSAGCCVFVEHKSGDRNRYKGYKEYR